MVTNNFLEGGLFNFYQGLSAEKLINVCFGLWKDPLLLP